MPKVSRVPKEKCSIMSAQLKRVVRGYRVNGSLGRGR